MCPLRLILVFFSAVMAGYFAWKTVRSARSLDIVDSANDMNRISHKEEQEFGFKRMVQNGFWVFTDMASGRYLWRNLKEMNLEEKVKSS